MKTNGQVKKTLLCLLVLGLMAALLCLRLPYGLDVTDEPYYSALPYRLYLGDRLFCESWEVHQLSGLIALPFVRLFLFFSGGSTAGIMLYFRFLLLAFQLGTAIYAYLVCKREMGVLPALLLSAMILLYAHYGINSFSYNMMEVLFTLLSFLCLYHAFDGQRVRGKLVCSGAFYALSVMAQPYFVWSLPVWMVFWMIPFVGKNSSLLRDRAMLTAGLKKKGALVGPGLFLCGILLVTGLVLVRVFLFASPQEVLTGIRGMLSDPDHGAPSFLARLGSYFHALWVLLLPAVVLSSALTLGGAALCLIKDEQKKKRFCRLGLWLCLLLAALGAVWVCFYDYPAYHKINLAAGILALLAPPMYFFNGKRLHPAMLLFFLGAFLSLSVQLGSNTGVRASSGALLPASLGAMLYLFAGTKALFSREKVYRLFTRLGCMACALTVLLTGYLRFTGVYRDGPMAQLTCRITQGPAAGVYTTEERGAMYGALNSAVTQYAPDQGAILVTNLMPVAYLMTELLPASPSVFNMLADSPWLMHYYAANPEKRPAYVFAVAGEWGSDNDLSLSGTGPLTAGEWETVLTPAGTAMTRLSD